MSLVDSFFELTQLFVKVGIIGPDFHSLSLGLQRELNLAGLRLRCRPNDRLWKSGPMIPTLTNNCVNSKKESTSDTGAV